MKEITTHKIEVSLGKPISMRNLMQLRHDYIKHYGHEPKEAMFSIDALNDLLASETLRDYANIITTPMTVLGMNVQVDRELQAGEWRIGVDSEVVRELTTPTKGDE